MEASGYAVRQIPHAPASLLRAGRGDVGIRRAELARVYVGGGGFFDEGHLRYYARCGVKAEKNRAKLAKGLSRDLSVLLESVAVSKEDGMVQAAASGKNITINEAASILLAHLDEARASASAKAMKKQDKEMRKVQKKAVKMNKCTDDSSSSSSESSSSESSESDCDEEEVVHMSCLRTRATAPPLTVVDVPASKVVTTPALPEKNTTALQIPEKKSEPAIECCRGDSKDQLPAAVVAIANRNVGIEVPARHVSDSFAAEENVAGGNTTACSRVAISPKDSSLSSSVAAIAATMDRLEVCVGGKCKKSGSLQLMEELKRQVGAQGAVVGCKCMGKCKEGPNVRVTHHKEDGAPPVRGPLCIGVGLEDVGAVVSSYLRDRDLGFVAAAS